MSSIRISTVAILVLLILCGTGFAQSKLQKKKKDSDGATIKGRFVQHEKKEFKIDLNELGCMLTQQVKLPEPPVPEERWPKMTPQEQADWVKQFEASEQFKEFMADRKKRIEAAERFEIQIEDNGNFVIYDVPPGLHGLRGGIEKTIDDKTYVFEVFGQINVAKDVEEVLLDPMTVVVTRLTKPNEAIPFVNVKTFDGKATINNKLLENRNVLVNFWSLKSPPSVEFAKIVQQTYKEVKTKQEIQLLSICVDSDRKKALKHIVDEELGGWHGYAKTWEHDTVSEFGVRSIPALFLLGADGKIKMNAIDFRIARNTPDVNLAKLITDVLSGKTVPTPVDTSDPAKEGESQKR